MIVHLAFILIIVDSAVRASAAMVFIMTFLDFGVMYLFHSSIVGVIFPFHSSIVFVSRCLKLGISHVINIPASVFVTIFPFWPWISEASC